MSEKARELANRLFRNEYDEEAEIDAAVAPLVEALGRVMRDSQRGTSGRIIMSHENESLLKESLREWTE